MKNTQIIPINSTVRIVLCCIWYLLTSLSLLFTADPGLEPLTPDPDPDPDPEVNVEGLAARDLWPLVALEEEEEEEGVEEGYGEALPGVDIVDERDEEEILEGAGLPCLMVN